MRTESPGHCCCFSITPRPLCSEKSHPWREMGQKKCTGLTSHFSFFSKLPKVILCEAQTRLTRIWVPDWGFWLVKSFLLWCLQLTMGCLWEWWLCFVFPSEIICSSALQRGGGGRIMQLQSGDKVDTVQEFESWSIGYRYRANYPAIGWYLV